MPSRKFTCEVDDIVLAKCVFFLVENGAELQGRTPSEVMNIVLGSYTAFLDMEGLSKEVPEPTEYLNAALGVFESENISVRKALIGGVIHTIREGFSTHPARPDAVESLVSSAMDYEVPTSIPPPQPVDPTAEEEEPIDLENPPWEGLEALPFSQLQEVAPKDILIEQLTTNPDPLLQKAVEVVYAIYPVQNWGNEACLKLVATTVENFTPYKELLK